MGPTTRSCLLCGHAIGQSGDHGAAWDHLFRIVYSFKEKIAVSGVGIVDDPRATHLVPPLDFAARRDTSKANVPIGIVRQKPVDDRYGYPIHDACWSLLAEAFAPEPIPEKRLFEICRSLPFSTRVDRITWNHDYGELISVDDGSFPWENDFVEGDVECASSDPFLVPGIEELLEDTSESPYSPMAMPKGSDIFAGLPLELIISISRHLPTADYFNARLASRSFYPVYHVQQFWASRFCPAGERSWLFESQRLPNACDWLSLYRRTTDTSPGIRNRERVWGLVEQAKDLLRSEWREPVEDSSSEAASSSWSKASADIRPETDLPYQSFGSGCRQLQEKQVHISPDQLSQIAFSIIRPGGITYITGMRFILRQGEAISLGFIADEECFRDAAGLTGFQLAVGSRGIQAIQCVLNGQQHLSWVGCPEDAPQTNRLSFPGPIDGFKAGFDGYKMVSLATTSCTPRQDSLRDTAFWYPRVPDSGLCLNENGFSARENALTKYEPVNWTMFGGPSGEYLKFLTGISVTADRGCPRGIEFHYSSDDVPMECRKVGKCTPSGCAKVMKFEIDGAGGEVIDSLKVHVHQTRQLNDTRWAFAPGFLESFEISTNRGNSYHFDNAGTRRRTSSAKKSISVVEGRPIQGLYWTQHENRIMALGAISES